MELKGYLTHGIGWYLAMGIILLALSQSASGSATEDDYLRLYNALTSNYSRHMRPIANQSAPVMIDMSFSLFFVSEMKDTESTITVISLMQVSWFDHNLVWNPQNYGGIGIMRLADDTIWAPIISLYLSQSDRGSIFETDTSHIVLHNGLVSFGNAASRSAFCEMDMTYFPYDYQKCDFSFNIIDASMLEVNISSATADLASTFIENKEWLVKDIAPSLVYFGYNMVLYRVNLILQRRPTFNNLNIIAPAIIVSILCMLTFMVPLESGERLSYTLTTVLSLSVYITYIGTLIPNSSHPVPVLFQYVVSLFIICGITVLLTLLIIKIRWSPVKRTADNRKYIRFFGFRLFFTKLRLLNKVGVLQRRDKSDNNIINKERHLREDAPTHKRRNTVVSMANVNCDTGEQYVNKDALKIQTELKQKRKSAGMINVQEANENTTGQDTDPEVDSDLLKLCQLLEASGFILTFVTFTIMTLYTLIRFYCQKEPTFD